MDSAVAVETAPVEVAPVVEKVVHMLSPLAKESAVTVETCL